MACNATTAAKFKTNKGKVVYVIFRCKITYMTLGVWTLKVSSSGDQSVCERSIVQAVLMVRRHKIYGLGVFAFLFFSYGIVFLLRAIRQLQLLVLVLSFLFLCFC